MGFKSVLVSLLLPTRLAGKDLTREKNKGERDSNCFMGFLEEEKEIGWLLNYVFWITRVHHHTQSSGENESSSLCDFPPSFLPFANFLLYSLVNRKTLIQESVYKYFQLQFGLF